MTANNKVSILSDQQLPFFIREEHPQLAIFLEKYYEFLEQPQEVLKYGRPIERVFTFLDSIDVDRNTHDEIAEELYKKFIQDLPVDVVADKALILKHVKDFYRARGTEKATKFLVNILTGDPNNEIYYPKKDILRASAGNWVKRRSLRVESVQIDGEANTSFFGLNKFANTRVTGLTSNASAVVESVNRFYESSALVSELFLTKVTGNFVSGEQIRSPYTENGINHEVTANVFPGYVSQVNIIDGGTGYSTGDQFIIESANGSGGIVEVTKVQTGNVVAIGVLEGGAGFRVGDAVLVSGTGSGANAYVSQVDVNSGLHPNSYTFYVGGILGDEANTALGDVFTNWNSGNANSAIYELMDEWIYDETGPAAIIVSDDGGTGYGSNTQATISSNSRVRGFGVLSYMEIVEAGEDYEANDDILFTNVTGGYGTHAYGRVVDVDGSGAIQNVEFVSIESMPPGGFGFEAEYLPTATVSSANGTNAVISVVGILGDGELLAVTNSEFGVIETVSITQRGSGYDTETTIDTSGEGNGDANLQAEVITGVFTGAGRFLNDDGFLSSHNFLRGPHYYQPHSYVVRSYKPLKEYKRELQKLTNPAGMKLFGTLKIELEDNEQIQVMSSDFEANVFDISLYTANTF